MGLFGSLGFIRVIRVIGVIVMIRVIKVIKVIRVATSPCSRASGSRSVTYWVIRVIRPGAGVVCVGDVVMLL